MISLSQQRILVTGGHGFLGQHLVRELAKHQPQHLNAPSKQERNLLDPANCRAVVKDTDIVIHAAAKVGGIESNRTHPGDYFYENALMGIQLLEAARQAGVKKFVQIGSVCEYPKEAAHLPYTEADLWDGYPEETNGPYGLAKKALLTMGQAYQQQHGINVIHLLLTNMYGPHDHFGQPNAHVIAALTSRFYQAKQRRLPEVVCWGTGTPTREFLYVEDAARGIMQATEHYDKPEPVNLGSGQEITVKDLATMIAEALGYTGRIAWDTTKPDGQPRRFFDTTKANQEFNFGATTSFEDGLKQTIGWYVEHIAEPAQEKIPARSRDLEPTGLVSSTKPPS